TGAPRRSAARQRRRPRRRRSWALASHAMMSSMPGDESDRSLEEILRSVATELGRSLERAVDSVDVDAAARSLGIDPEAVRGWTDAASGWLRTQVEEFGEELGSSAAALQRGFTDPGELSSTPGPRDLPDD